MTRPLPVPADRLAVDLHVHTLYSKDSLSTLEDLIAAAQAVRLSGLAITDHNQIEGALRLRDAAPFAVIVGEEVQTAEGEIIGLYLERRIPAGLSPEETVAAIREQEGLVYLPHPCDRIRRSTLSQAAIERIIGQVDAVEVINARVLSSRQNAEAWELAERHGIAMGAGSDAHTPGELAGAYVLLPLCDLTDASSFGNALRRARPMGGLNSPLVHLSSTLARLRKRLKVPSRSVLG
ncbi:MAG: PHP domain-containing protein [Anaerolineae bacterium]|nr:PHP domain-containing protein [Anaerolineae bacterium]